MLHSSEICVATGWRQSPVSQNDVFSKSSNKTKNVILTENFSQNLEKKIMIRVYSTLTFLWKIDVYIYDKMISICILTYSFLKNFQEKWKFEHVSFWQKILVKTWMNDEIIRVESNCNIAKNTQVVLGTLLWCNVF